MEKYLLSIMKNKFLNVALFLLLMIPCCIYAQDNLSALIPMPNKVTSDSDMVLVLENQVNCYIETDSLEFELNTLSSIFNKRFGINVKRSTESSKSVVQLLIDKSLKTKEHYQLSVNEKRLVIKGATSAAVFYGLMTLDQILAGDICATKQKTIASVEIDDCPRFDYRALMLDPARNFLPIDDIKFYIDQMVKYKFNVLQLHLTDDHGWSIWIESHPSLAGARFYTKKDIQELVDYAASKNVGIILWAGYYAFDRDMENVCRHYADMGVKGFKVDFMDRDDQLMTAFNYRAAEMCAKYKLILDLHGTHKPAGMNRTYPNVLNFEGVNGLEQMKWSPASVDQVKYDVMLPFTRQVSGPMDYTQGAMRNASKGNYYPCNSEPMSQGTRCRQLALYVVFESPFNMLCDTPSNYMREPESTGFIADVPTVWDESIVLDGKMGEYIVTARRSGNVWYVGGITDWTARDIEVDCSFLGGKTYDATLFKDGANAHRIGRDYKCESIRIKNDSKLKIHLAPGGGFALKIK